MTTYTDLIARAENFTSVDVEHNLLVGKFRDLYHAGDRNVRSFADNLKDDAFYAFQWAERAMTGAAQMKLALQVLIYVLDTPSVTTASLRGFLTEELLRVVSGTKRSTSVVSNDVESRYAEVLANVIRDLG